jgi:hypothetical protein
MASGKPDGKHVHAASERDYGIVCDSQQDQTDSTQVAKAAPDGNCEQKMQMQRHLGWEEFTGQGVIARNDCTEGLGEISLP